MINETATGMALAKQILMDCEGEGTITLPKETVKTVLLAFVKCWSAEQDKKRSEFKKVAS